MIRKVALCGGAGAFLLPRAVASGADVFITGEVKYHDYFSYENSILVAEIGAFMKVNNIQKKYFIQSYGKCFRHLASA